MSPATATQEQPDVRAPRHRPITVEEYHRMADVGILDEDERLELLDGRLIAMSPVGPAHIHCVNRLTKLFARRLYVKGDPAPWISTQNPIRLGDVGEPEPDLTLLSADAPQDRMPQASDVLLVVEVAESSVDYERTVKTPRYAEAGIPVCWIVELDAEVVDVFSHPEGDTYTERRRHRRGDAVPMPDATPGEAVDVDDILGLDEPKDAD